MWLLFAVCSTCFAEVTAVLVFSWLLACLTGSAAPIAQSTPYIWTVLILSGLATGASWLCCYKALQEGPASVVEPVDKLSILVTIGFSYVVFREKLSKQAEMGLLCVVVGTLLMI